MKSDVVTIAIFVFGFGILVSGVSSSDVFYETAAAPSALQQGFSIR